MAMGSIDIQLFIHVFQFEINFTIEKAGPRILYKQAEEAIVITNQISNLKEATGLGWQLKKPQWLYMGNLSSKRTIGQTGYTGCFVMCDPENDIAIAMISNRTFPKRPGNGDAINAVRSDLVDIVYKT